MEHGNGGARRDNPDMKRMWRRMRPLIVFLLSLGICLTLLFVGAKVAFEKLFAPVDANDATPITLQSLQIPALHALRSSSMRQGGRTRKGTSFRA